MPRCPKGTRRNPKTGKCESKPLTRGNAIKKTCSFSAHPCLKKDAVKVGDLRKDKTVVSLTPAFVSELVAEYNFTGMQILDMQPRLRALVFNPKFVGDFYEAVDANRLWVLSCQYGKDNMKGIKEHLLKEQARSLVSSVAKGYIAIEEI